MKSWPLFVLAYLLTASANAKNPDVICSYAPSQSIGIAAFLGTAGGAGAAITAIGQATGLSVVAHSSGAYILTGTSGYIAGTLGAAGTAPIIVTVGVLVAGAGATIELACAPRNHPIQVAKIMEAARKFTKTTNSAFGTAKDMVTIHVVPATIRIKKIVDGVFQ
jgi:hypothetical protein